MNIHEKRIAAGLLQKDVMKDTGLLSKIENGKALACPDDIERMAVLFNCKPQELFTGEEDAFFKKTFAGGKLHSHSAKNENKAVCKPAKMRKCFWLDRSTNNIFEEAIHTLGFSSMQSWFDAAVDETIKQASYVTEKKGNKISMFGDLL